MCLMGRVALGACFSATFGMLAAQANGPELWWAPVPGMVLGSTFGVVLGMHPDSMPSASLVAVCFLSALATNPPAAYLLPSSPDPLPTGSALLGTLAPSVAASAFKSYDALQRMRKVTFISTVQALRQTHSFASLTGSRRGF